MEPADLKAVSLCEVLDRVLNKGVVLKGEVTVSVAGVDLLYVGLNLLLCSTETLNRVTSGAALARERAEP